MKTHSELKKVKQGEYTYIYIYYKHKGTIIRINTNNKYVVSCMNKDLTYNTKMVNHVELNQKTMDLKRKVDDYIGYKVKTNSLGSISQKQCLKYINEGEESFLLSGPFLEMVTRKPKSVTEHLNDFYQFKKDELNSRSSYKDYLSFVNSLIDFQKYYRTKLTFEKMNSLEFMNKYRRFLTEKRGDDYLTTGGMNDNTINKRFSSLKTFFRWCEVNDIYVFRKVVHDFSIPKFSNNVVVLTKDEISHLLSLTFKNPTWERVRDVFCCNCFLGLRISDLKTLKKTDFYLDEDGDYILIKENKKTGVKVMVPIVQTPLEILKKYDFELPKLSDQYFNRELKKLLEDKDLFGEPVTKIRRVYRDIQDTEVPRRKLITSHTCRRTFVTLGLSNNIPINSLMLSSGHKQIQTLQKYMSKVLDKKSFKRLDLDYVPDGEKSTQDSTE